MFTFLMSLMGFPVLEEYLMLDTRSNRVHIMHIFSGENATYEDFQDVARSCALIARQRSDLLLQNLVSVDTGKHQTEPKYMVEAILIASPAVLENFTVKAEGGQ